MNNRYKHKQTGWLIIYIFAVGLIFSGFLTAFQDWNLRLFLLMIIFGICLALFYQLTITIGENHLEIQFGIGVIKKKFLLKNIAECRTVKNPWYYGWGIHLTPYGWLYNVSGYDAVEVTTKDGRKYRIGTDAPNDLEQTLHSPISGDVKN